jgi:hypothetical protein
MASMGSQLLLGVPRPVFVILVQIVSCSAFYFVNSCTNRASLSALRLRSMIRSTVVCGFLRWKMFFIRLFYEINLRGLGGSLLLRSLVYVVVCIDHVHLLLILWRLSLSNPCL